VSERERTLARFIDAQSGGVYEKALEEIKAGRKRSHWMWFIFPQLEGLGFSHTSRFYGLQGLPEARNYLDDQTLGHRLRELCGALLELPTNDPHRVFGSPDDLKLLSSMTMFELAAGGKDTFFGNVLEKFYGGQRCLKTRQMFLGDCPG
jgi:uncharacterized protein (DUF1810 family)